MAPPCRKTKCRERIRVRWLALLIGWAGLSLAALAAPALAAPAWSQPQLQPSALAPQSNLAPAAERGISVERAARIAQRETGGRVLSTNPTLRGGEVGVEVRLLINGARVTKVFVDSDGEVRGR